MVGVWLPPGVDEVEDRAGDVPLPHDVPKRSPAASAIRPAVGFPHSSTLKVTNVVSMLRSR